MSALNYAEGGKKLERRHLLIGTGLSLALGPANIALAQIVPTPLEDDTQIISSLPPLPADLASNAAAEPAPYTDTALVGTASPTGDEIRKAYEILVNSPRGVAPIDIAQYFLAVGAGAYGVDYRVFAREWPIRANPMIYHFFAATQTKPEGDRTAWCAAFLNWCSLRSRATTADEIGKAPGAFSQSGKSFSNENVKNYSTNSASSGSFRCWNDITSPRRGDIAGRFMKYVAVK